jgi:hypothetical protein
MTTLLQMPVEKYMDERAFEFEQLAAHAKTNPLDLRVALSNVFVSMARQGHMRTLKR